MQSYPSVRSAQTNSAISFALPMPGLLRHWYVSIGISRTFKAAEFDD